MNGRFRHLQIFPHKTLMIKEETSNFQVGTPGRYRLNQVMKVDTISDGVSPNCHLIECNEKQLLFLPQTHKQNLITRKHHKP